METNNNTAAKFTTATAARIATIFGLSFVAMIGICSEPLETSPTWTMDFLTAKAIGAAAIYAVAKLWQRWRKTDEWLKAYERKCDEVCNKPNPMYIGKEEDE